MKVYDANGRLKLLQASSGGGSDAPVIIANCRNLVIQSLSTVQALLTADEVIVKVGGTGGSLLVVGPSIVFSITGGVGLNGFETGAVRAVSRWYYVWLISDGTNARVVLEDAGAGDGILPNGPDLTGGAFTGYTYMALVGQIRLNATGSGEIVPFAQYDRTVFIEETLIYTAQLAVTTDVWEVLTGVPLASFRACVPPNGRMCGGSFGWIGTNVGCQMGIAGANSDGTVNTTNPVGVVWAIMQQNGVIWNGWTMGVRYSVPVRGGNGRNIQWKTNRSDAIGRSRLVVSSYTF